MKLLQYYRKRKLAKYFSLLIPGLIYLHGEEDAKGVLEDEKEIAEAVGYDFKAYCLKSMIECRERTKQHGAHEKRKANVIHL